MKHSLLFSCLLCLTLLSFAQDWAPVHAGEKHNFRRDSSDVITHTLWVDSVGVVGGDSTFWMNTTFGRCEGCGPDTNRVYFRAESPHFLQKRITKIAPSHYQLADTGLIDIQAFQPVGASWSFEPGSGVTATVISATDSLFWGQVQDSVKTLALSDGGRIILSKSHGLLLWDRLDMRYRLTGLQEGRVLGEQVPMFWDFYDFEVGDVFQYGGIYNSHGSQWFSMWMNRMKIIEKVRLSSDSVRYVRAGYKFWKDSQIIMWQVGSARYGFSNSYGCCPSTKDTIIVIETKDHCANRWPSEFVPITHVDNHYAQISISKNSKGVHKKSLNRVGNYSGRQVLAPVRMYPGIFQRITSNQGYWNEAEYLEGVGLILEDGWVFEVEWGERLIGALENDSILGNLDPESAFWPTGLQPSDQNASFSLYPNPTSPSQSLHLSTAEADNWELRLLSMDGKVQHQAIFSGKETTLNVPALPSGMYLVELYGSNGKVMRQKVLIRQ